MLRTVRHFMAATPPSSSRLVTLFRYVKLRWWKFLSRGERVVGFRGHPAIKMHYRRGCTITEKVFAVGEYDYPGMRLFQSLLGEGDLFFDIGANVGPFSVLISTTGADIHAFEPHPDVIKVLRKNLLLNGVPSSQAHQFAVSSKVGTANLTDLPQSSVNHLLFSDGAGEYPVFAVPCTTLDALAEIFGPPSAIKVDTEGHERQVFEGGQCLLRSGSVRVISFEANGLSTRDDLSWIQELLTSCGFLIGLLDWHDRRFTVTDISASEKSPTGDYIAVAREALPILERFRISILTDHLGVAGDSNS